MARHFLFQFPLFWADQQCGDGLQLSEPAILLNLLIGLGISMPYLVRPRLYFDSLAASRAPLLATKALHRYTCSGVGAA